MLLEGHGVPNSKCHLAANNTFLLHPYVFSILRNQFKNETR